MKLRAMLAICDKDDLSVDMYTDYSDDLAIAYVGDSGCHLTDEGEKEFKSLLDLDVAWKQGDEEAIIKINHIKDNDEVEKVNTGLVRLFYSLAGYCTCTEYDKWFKCN